MLRYSIIFYLSFTVFLFFLTPNINTGDAGEFIAAAQYIGIAHPSGYPLYLLIAKTLTFLPVGNMAFKVALVSALFSSLSLILVYWIITKLTSDMLTGIFSITLLSVSYSFFTQSVIAKFYPLNLFLILTISALWIAHLQDDQPDLKVQNSQFRVDKEQALHLTSFLLGLSTSNHHTGIIILGPVLFAWILTKPTFNLRIVTGCIILFSLGFAVNVYLLLRGGLEHFFNSVYVRNLHDFFQVIFRTQYQESSTVSAVSAAFNTLSLYWQALRNFIVLLKKSFSVFSFIFFLAGCYFLLRKNWKLFLFLMGALSLYGLFLSKLTLAGNNIQELDYYIAAHQYFLPGLAFFVMVASLGFFQMAAWLRASRFQFLAKSLPLIFAFFPLVFLMQRAVDSNYRTNHVPYQATKDTFSILPVNSVILSYGDNAIYQGWYIKLVGRYREDVCQMGVAEHKNPIWGYHGCSEKLYDKLYPSVFTHKVRNMIPVMTKNRFYGSDSI